MPEGSHEALAWGSYHDKLSAFAQAMPYHAIPLPSLLVPSSPTFSALGQEKLRSFCQRRQQLNRNYMTLTSTSLNFSSSSTGWLWIAPRSFPCDSDGIRLYTGTSEMSC